MRLLRNETPSERSLIELARAGGYDAVTFIATSGPLRATVVGRGIHRATFGSAAEGTSALSEIVASLGAHIARFCAIEHTPVDHAPAGSRLQLQVQTGPCVTRVRARLRRAGERAFATAQALAGAPLWFDLVSSERPYALEYMVDGLSEAGNIVAALGTTQAPLRVLIEADHAQTSRRPWYKRGWVWAAAGVAVAGIATASVLALQQHPGTEVRFGP
jgi:hypothetical protein